jgi:ParB family chromosome partitioning protein
MDYKIRPVSLDQIETNDPTFRITTNTDTTDLALSISAIGVLQPPVVIKKQGGYRVVCGFRRIAACSALKHDHVPARILHSDVSTLTCAQIAISDNSLQRPLNVVEQSRAYALVQKVVDGSPAWRKIAASTGLPGSQSAVDRILPVADMPVCMQNGILEGSIALPIALHISRLNEADAKALCIFFRALTTSLNVQRELLELISEISLRDDISIVQLMEQDQIAAIMGNGNFSVPQKVHALRVMLKTKRYPELSRAEALYGQNAKSLKLDPRVQLHPPRFFEGTTYRLSLTFNSRQQLKSLQPELEKLVQHPTLLPD